MQNDIEEGFVNTDTTVVLDEAQFAEPVHEEADARTCGSDHLSQCFLRDRWNERLWLSGFAELRHQQEYPGQALFAVIEQLIDEVRLRAHTTGQQEL